MPLSNVNKSATQLARSFGLDEKTVISLSGDLMESILFDECLDGDFSVYSRANYLTANMIAAIVENLAESNFQFRFLLNCTSVLMELEEYDEIRILHVDLDIMTIH